MALSGKVDCNKEADISALALGLTQKNVGLVDEILEYGFEKVYYHRIKDDGTSAGLLLIMSPHIIVVTRVVAVAPGVRELYDVAALMMIPVSMM